MAQQMVNGSYHNGSVTMTNRMTRRYAVVNPPFCGKHLKSDPKSLRRQEAWERSQWRKNVPKNQRFFPRDSNNFIGSMTVIRRSV